MQRFFLIILVCWLGACTSEPSNSAPSHEPTRYTYEVVNRYPHQTDAFTQGLIYVEGVLYESVGRYGYSALREVDLIRGEVLRQHTLSADYFAEGLTLFDNRLIQLTWREETGFVYDRTTFEVIDTFEYLTQGWGLTHDGEHLIMSDGSSTLYFLDPQTYEVISKLPVREGSRPITRLNELEYIEGYIYANVWQTEQIVIIHPVSGQVAGWIDLTGLRPPSDQPVDVLNGIAYETETGHLFVTGKLWPLLFEIKLIEVK
ncbi:MAG: glutaminyl-peptide cyclotransferase [Gemmatimonadetes bacterium]|nr:MAG: glutaminyl-peptide cyclotransferase [Gemmatimonadota bacterium]